MPFTLYIVYELIQIYTVTVPVKLLIIYTSNIGILLTAAKLLECTHLLLNQRKQNKYDALWWIIIYYSLHSTHSELDVWIG